MSIKMSLAAAIAISKFKKTEYCRECGIEYQDRLNYLCGSCYVETINLPEWKAEKGDIGYIGNDNKNIPKIFDIEKDSGGSDIIELSGMNCYFAKDTVIFTRKEK